MRAGFDSCNRITAACLNTLALRQLSHLVSAMLESSANCPYSQEKELCNFSFFPLSLVLFFWVFLAAADVQLCLISGICPAGAHRNACTWDPAHQRGRQKKKKLTGDLKAMLNSCLLSDGTSYPFELFLTRYLSTPLAVMPWLGHSTHEPTQKSWSPTPRLPRAPPAPHEWLGTEQQPRPRGTECRKPLGWPSDPTRTRWDLTQ